MANVHRPNDLSEWLTYISEIHAEAIELGLDRVADVYLRLLSSKKNSPATKEPQQADKSPKKSNHHELSKPLEVNEHPTAARPTVITFAGTNGKGSTLALTEALALKNGKRVGAYTSPHLLRFNERFRINGSDVSDRQLIQSFVNIEGVREATPLTYFEFATLVAFDLFISSNLDFWLLEVGLGGRLDAVNIVDPDIAVITTVDLDHQEWLGTDREQIGSEKAGILRAGIPVVLGSTDLPTSVFLKISELSANKFVLNEDFSLKNHRFFSRRTISENKVFTLELLSFPDLPSDNIATALQIARLLALDISCLGSKPFPALALQGRFQQIRNNPAIVLDVAHNPHAARYLACWLNSNPVQGKNIAVFSSLQDKDVQGIVAALRQHFYQWHVFAMNDSRAMDLDLLQSHVRVVSQAQPERPKDALDSCSQPGGGAASRVPGVFAHKRIEDALAAAAAAAGEHGRILVFGSFMAVAAVYETGIISEL